MQSAIGQGDNRVTPLQLCVYASTLATGGTRYKATFLNRVVSSDYRSLIRQNTPVVANYMEISDATYNTYLQGMRNVIAGNYGTGRDAFGGPKDGLPGDTDGVWPYKDIAVCAKTGTAQTFKDRSDNGAYVCFAPMEDPEIAIAVYGEKAGSGSAMGAVAKGILDNYFDIGDSGEITTYENTMS